MNSFTVEVHDQAVKAALSALQARLSNMQPLLQRMGDEMKERATARFASSTAPDGQPWKANAPATVKAKGPGKPPLVDSGDLRDAIAAQASASQLTMSVAQPYAAIHQFGGTIQKKAGQTTVSHRTNAKGELLRSQIMNGKGLIFASRRHADSRKLTRTFAVPAHAIKIDPRPYLPVRADGSLYPQEQTELLALLNAFLAQRP